MNRARFSDNEAYREAYRRGGYRNVYAQARAPVASAPAPPPQRSALGIGAGAIATGLAGAVLPIAAAAAYARYAAPPGAQPTWIEMDELRPATGRPLLGMAEYLAGELVD